MLEFTIDFMEGCRGKTLGLLDRVKQSADPAATLAWRPGVGRAHIGWQLMHIAATEEKFAFGRLQQGELRNPDLYEAYGHGSTPSDEPPTIEQIESYLVEARGYVQAAIRSLDGQDLSEQPPQMADRGWCYADALKLLVWHEGHHQGQGHITMNLYEATPAS